MLKKNYYTLFLNLYTLRNTNHRNSRIFIPNISITSVILNSLVSVNFNASTTLNKNSFIGLALSLYRWELFKKITNLSLSNTYWHVIRGHSLAYG